MTLQAFPTSPQPSFPVKKSSQPNTRTIRFADGFEQRIFFGLASNQNPKTFTFVWKNITETESDTIETFLDDRALDNKAFTYQPHGESSTMTFVCETWSKDMNFPNRATINATFRQVFEA
jgi:phage-related protein|tara:strand:+ start:2303 stop:2662 length:360 start_codon:yes stop_codon:yes gene_type:complete